MRFIEDIRSIGRRDAYFLCTYMAFIAGFFLIPNVKWHKSFFYIFMLVPYIITIKGDTFAILWNSRIIRSVSLLMGFLVMTLIWGARGSLHDYWMFFHRLLSVIVFIALTCELTLSHKQFINRVFTLQVWMSLIGAVAYVALSQYQFTYPPVRLNDIGVLRDPVEIGGVYGMVLIVLYYHFILRKYSWSRVSYGAMLLASFIIFILIQSRGPLLAVMIAFLVGSLITKDIKMLIILFFIAAASVLLISSGERFLYDLIITRGTSYRLEIFRYALDDIRDNLFWGHGVLYEFTCVLSSGVKIRSAHNLYLATWLYGGLVGLFLLMVMLATALKQSILYFQYKRNCIYFILLIYSIICVFTGYERVVCPPHPFYMFFWMPIGFLSAHEIMLRDRRLKE